MSAQTAWFVGDPAPLEPPQRRSSACDEPGGASSQSRQLHVVDAPARTRRAAFVTVIMLILAVGLAGLLLLHTWAAQDGFKLASLQRQQATLSAATQSVAEIDQRLESPSRLTHAARRLGMRAAGVPRIVYAKHGRIVGKALVPLQAVPPPSVATQTPASKAATGRASASTSSSPARKAVAPHSSPKTKPNQPVTASGSHRATVKLPPAAGHRAPAARTRRSAQGHRH